MLFETFFTKIFLSFPSLVAEKAGYQSPYGGMDNGVVSSASRIWKLST